MQPVGELDHDHPDIVRHGQNHLADVLGLGLFPGIELHLADLGHPFHNEGHILAELAHQICPGGNGVLDGIVQKPGGNGRRIQLQAGQNIGHFKGMRKIGLPGQSDLTGMGGGGKNIGLLNEPLLERGKIGADLVQDFVDSNHCGMLLRF